MSEEIFRLTARGKPDPIMVVKLEHSEQPVIGFEVTVRMDTSMLKGAPRDEAWVLMQLLGQYLADVRRSHERRLAGNYGECDYPAASGES